MGLTFKKGFCECEDCPNKGKEVQIRCRKCYACNLKQFRSCGKDKPQKAKKYKPTGEKTVFELIWNQRPHRCVSCGQWLGDVAISDYFSHIVRTSKNEDLRLRPDNIVLECKQCHDNWDCGTIDKKMKSKIWDKKLEYIKKNQTDLYERLTEQENEYLQKVALLTAQVQKD